MITPSRIPPWTRMASSIVTAWVTAGFLITVGGCKDDTATAPTVPADTHAADTHAADTETADTHTADSGRPDTAAPRGARFPESFLWGTAIAGFQVDMGCPTLPAAQCEDRQSDWYQFVTSPEMIAADNTFLSGDLPSAGPGYWELYDSDHQRARDLLHNNALRLSIEWSRIFPTATDQATGYEALKALADPDAVAHYHAIFASLKAHKLTPLVTLNHYTLPLWIHDGVGCHQDVEHCSPRGWLDKDRTVTELAKYAGFVAAEFGGEVDRWVTLNEPFAVLMPGYILPTEDRVNPPGLFLHLDGVKTVMLGLVEAHARMYDAIHAADLTDADQDGTAASVGVVYSMVPVVAKDPTLALDVQAAKNVFYIYNMVYLNAVCLGMLDPNLDGHATLRDDLAGRMDYLGINYYTRIKVSGTAQPVLPGLSPLTTFDPLNMDLWENYPRGIYEMIQVAQNDLHVPVLITENGTDRVTDNAYAQDALVRTLGWVHQAITEGAEVGGYFYWSLLDNYEWNHGMNLRFGLFAVDDQDPQKPRTARPFSATYGQIAQQNGISDALQAASPRSQ